MESAISFIHFVCVGLSSISSIYTRYLHPIPRRLWINFVSASIKGQPLYKGQKACSQCVRYSEVPLYCKISMRLNLRCAKISVRN